MQDPSAVAARAPLTASPSAPHRHSTDSATIDTPAALSSSTVTGDLAVAVPTASARLVSSLAAITAPHALPGVGVWPPAGGAVSGAPGIALSQIHLPGLSLAITDITDASHGSGGMRAAQGLRTHTVLDATLDLEQFVGWQGATLFAQHKMKRGANGSGAAGLMQAHSNIDADDFRAAGEIWLQQQLFDEAVRIKAGRLDFNSEFAGTENGGAFLNASMGFSPSIAAAPTFPLPISALNLVVSPRAGGHISLGAFDGSDGAPAVPGFSSRFYIGQLSQSWSRDGHAFDGRVSLGSWHHTGMFSAVDDDDDAPDVQGASGWYGTMDLTLWRAAHADSVSDDDAPSAAMFVQVGRGNPRLQAVNIHQGVGFVTHGVVPHRRSDAIGVGVTHAGWSGGRETIGEAFYHAPIGSHLTLVADLQHVGHVDALGRRSGFIPNLRTIVNF
jgi:carbohydrate-selective porin OprB